MDFQLFETPFKCATFNVHKVMCMERLLGKINSYPQKQWFTLKDLWRKYQCPIKLSTGTNIAKPSCHRETPFCGKIVLQNWALTFFGSGLQVERREEHRVGAEQHRVEISTSVMLNQVVHGYSRTGEPFKKKNNIR